MKDRLPSNLVLDQARQDLDMIEEALSRKSARKLTVRTGLKAGDPNFEFKPPPLQPMYGVIVSADK